MDGQGQLTLLESCRIVWRRRWWILVLVVAAVMVAFVLGRLQPKVYVARATMLTPKENAMPATSAAGFLGGLGGGREGGGGGLSVPGIMSVLPSLNSTEDMFMALLRSRTLRERVVQELATTGGPSVGSRLLSADASARDKGTIVLTVEATDGKLAADFANAYFDQLDRVLEENAGRTRKRQERFYASQLEQSAKEVAAAEDALLKFQTQNRMLVNLDPANKKDFDSAVGLRGNIMQLELQREMLKMRFTDQHPALREVQKQIAELKRQYSQNLYGLAMELPPEGPGVRGGRQEFFVSAAKVTPLQFEFLKLLRNLKIQEAFYTGAIQGLEQIKYQDGASPVVVEVLDPALPASRPARPNVTSIVTVAVIAALVVGVLLAFLLEYLARLRAAEVRAASPVPVRARRSDDGAEPLTVAPGADGVRVPVAAKAAPAHPASPGPGRPAAVPGGKR